jgi:hypothetical protein
VGFEVSTVSVERLIRHEYEDCPLGSATGFTEMLSVMMHRSAPWQSSPVMISYRMLLNFLIVLFSNQRSSVRDTIFEINFVIYEGDLDKSSHTSLANLPHNLKIVELQKHCKLQTDKILKLTWEKKEMVVKLVRNHGLAINPERSRVDSNNGCNQYCRNFFAKVLLLWLKIHETKKKIRKCKLSHTRLCT